jgi:hypothetical protein
LLVYIGTYFGAKSKGIYGRRGSTPRPARWVRRLAAETPSDFLAVHHAAASCIR